MLQKLHLRHPLQLHQLEEALDLHMNQAQLEDRASSVEHLDKAFADMHLDILAVVGCNLDKALLLPLPEEEAYHKVH